MLKAVILVVAMASVVSVQAQCKLSGGEEWKSPVEFRNDDVMFLNRENLSISVMTIDRLVIRHQNLLSSISTLLAGPTVRVPADEDNTIIILTHQEPNKSTAWCCHLNSLSANNCTANPFSTCTQLRIFGAQMDDLKILHVNNEGTFHSILEIAWGNSRRSGTFMYRALAQGYATKQADSGLNGILIIEDAKRTADVSNSDLTIPDELYDISCPEHCEHDIQLLFQSTLQYSSNATTREMPDFWNSLDLACLRDPANGVDYFTTNGILHPVLTIDTGQIKRVRLVNGGSNNTLRLGIEGNHCEVGEVAIDGSYLASMRPLKGNRTILLPSSTTDWIVLTSMSPIHDTLSSFDGLLLTLNVSGSETTTQLPALNDLNQADPAATESSDISFALEVGTNNQINRKTSSQGQTANSYNTTQGQHFWFVFNTDPLRSYILTFERFKVKVISYNNYSGPIYVQNGDEWQLCYAECDSAARKPCCSTTDICADYTFSGETTDVVGNENLLNELRTVVAIPPLGNLTIAVQASSTATNVEIASGILPELDGGARFLYSVSDDPQSTAEPDSCDSYSCHPCNIQFVPLDSLSCSQNDLERPTCITPSPPTTTPLLPNETTPSTDETTPISQNETTASTVETTIQTTTPSNPGVVAGSVVGVVAFIAVLAGLMYYLRQKFCSNSAVGISNEQTTAPTTSDEPNTSDSNAIPNTSRETNFIENRVGSVPGTPRRLPPIAGGNLRNIGDIPLSLLPGSNSPTLGQPLLMRTRGRPTI